MVFVPNFRTYKSQGLSYSRRTKTQSRNITVSLLLDIFNTKNFLLLAMFHTIIKFKWHVAYLLNLRRVSLIQERPKLV